MRKLYNKFVHPDSTLRLFMSMASRHPATVLQAFFMSLAATYALTGAFTPIRCIVFPGIRLRISKHPTALASLNARLIYRMQSNMSGCSTITLGENSRLSLAGDFEIGQGVSLTVSSNAELSIKGRDLSSGSGITSDTKVMVERKLSIGSDVIIAWGCTITDSDWHDIEGVSRSSPVTISDRVWISHGVSVLKGADIPTGCIVGARSIVGSACYPESALIAGNPAIVRKEGVSWKR